MMKNFTFLLFGLIMTTAISAQNVIIRTPLRGIPVSSAKKTIHNVPMKRSAHVLFHKAPAADETSDTPLLTESFSKMSAGSENAIDSTDLTANYLVNGDMTIDPKWTETPGWTGISVHQAGGCCALYHPNFGGVLNTPLGTYYGKIKISFRAKSVGETCLLYVAIGKGDPSEPDETSQDYLAKTLSSSDGWVNCSYEISNPYDDPSCFIQFNAYDDGALIDDIKVVRDADFMAVPTDLYADYFTHDGFTTYWNNIKSASDYLVSLYQFKERSNTNDSITQNFNAIKYDATTGKIDSLNTVFPEGWAFKLNPDGQQMIKSGIDSTAAICFSNDD